MQLTFVGCGDAFGSGGRFNTCLHLTGAAHPWIIDCGASSYLGLRKAAVDLNAVSTLLITHFHGDHFGGVPFVLLDALFVSRRRHDLTIIGPRGIADRTREVMQALFPASFDHIRAFRLIFHEIMPGETLSHEAATIEAFRMVHDPAVGPCNGYRITAAGRTLAFSGDSTWTEDLIGLGRDADLFVCECYSYDAAIPSHLNYLTLAANLPRVGARRVVLTHMNEDMLAARAKVAEECAEDGLTIALT